MRTLDASKLKFLDEASASTALHRAYGWAVRGEPAYIESARRGQRVTLLAAIGIDGVSAHTVLEEAMNGEAFKKWLREELAPTLKPGDVLVMDNLRTHKVAGVEEIVQAAGASTLYLPRYSPELNPIEMCWAYLKHFLRRLPRRKLTQLREGIARAWERVSAPLCAGWARHCGYAA